MNAYEPGAEGGRAAGLMASLRQMLSTALTLIHTRVELFTTEVEEEIQRAAQILLWALVALFFGSLTVLFVAVTILVAFWEEHRLLAAALITVGFLALTLTTALLARARLRSKPRFMSATIEELKRDRAILERNQ